MVFELSEDEFTIITEFPKEELEKLVAFCHEGILPETEDATVFSGKY